MLKLFIPGAPPTVTAQMKGVRCVPTNGATLPMFYKKKALKLAENHYLSSIPRGNPYKGPVGVRIEFQWPWRKSEPKKNRARGFKPKYTKPDADNSTKLVLDCLTKQQFGISDDAQIAELTALKTWGDDPGTFIQVWALEDGLWQDRSCAE